MIKKNDYNDLILQKPRRQNFDLFFPITNSTEVFQEIENIAKKFLEEDKSYPLYNIYTQNDKKFIEIATTGFSKDELQFYIDDNGFLVIEAFYINENKEEQEQKEYQIRNLSRRKFIKKFELSKNTEVGDIVVKDGIATIELLYKEPKKQLLTIKEGV
jgi:HSP20 family molecular chaperone IbpA